MDNYTAQKEKKSSERKAIAAKSILLSITILVVAFVLFLLVHRSTQSPHALSSTLTSQRSTELPSQSPSQLESCAVRKEGNPLVQNVTVIDDVVVGQFEGMVTSMIPSSGSATITIASFTGNQLHTLTIPKTIPVYDVKATAPLPFDSIQTGKTVLVTFNCFEKKQNKYEFTSIGVESN